MRRTTMFMSAAAVVFSAATAFAQAPSFAGHWMYQADPNAAAAAGGRGGRGGPMGMEFTATQDAKTLTITRMMGQTEQKTVYNLDGSDSHNMVAGFGGGGGRGGAAGSTPPAPTDQLSKAKWDGAKLVITTTTNFNGTPMDRVQTWSMDAGNLVIESTGQGRGGAAPTTMKSTYKKM